MTTRWHCLNITLVVSRTHADTDTHMRAHTHTKPSFRAVTGVQKKILRKLPAELDGLRECFASLQISPSMGRMFPEQMGTLLWPRSAGGIQNVGRAAQHLKDTKLVGF